MIDGMICIFLLVFSVMSFLTSLITKNIEWIKISLMSLIAAHVIFINIKNKK